MRVLLDTHVLIWTLVEPDRLGKRWQTDIENPANTVLFSAVSIWEIAIKARLGRVDFPVRPEEIAAAAVESGFAEYPVTAAVAALVAGITVRHRDPFDHLLLAQAMAEPARLLTADAVLVPYSELVTLIG
ncbi:type II toxin-antitoxin system VapC family toxin [Acidiphilium iwatense]|uniref:Type II toxin-antitoxin system VapC family toxin n=1 Tax=Acidiphilium iwatense TaxID=768198 RepID=A0ABS9DY93_9PROT|nr:type II toxin-antitoxin system VapC family toxin [Acidiphilium iwatense]MCF3946661.1 type II toxin-antitoxin system VapC family toxin [Acidiphilium iwatense]